MTFALGGTRSGKSRFALARARELGGDRVTYVATARPGDPELDARIAGHRAYRPTTWKTVEAGTDLAGTVALVDPGQVVLLDSLTLWASWCLDDGIEISTAWDSTFRHLAARGKPSVIVSDEVGLGIVPMTESGRRFTDEMGVLHQRVASQAALVVFMVAGLPIVLKGSL
jgi:adenosylcobinamide kinase/adenosylcobinamide-phosphate guanylyltransferase